MAMSHPWANKSYSLIFERSEPVALPSGLLNERSSTPGWANASSSMSAESRNP